MKLLKRSNGNIPRSNQEREEMISKATIAYGEFLTALGFDWKNDANSDRTPYRVAKSWVDDLMNGCITEAPKITSFPNEDKYSGMVIQSNIPVRSMCSHHNLPFVGQAHVAYIPGTSESSTVIGLSKLNRVVNWFATRPQIQEGLTKQIHDFIVDKCEGNRGVAVVIEAEHMCVKCRGIKNDSMMRTSQLSGYFFSNEIGTRTEFFNLINRK